LCSAGGVARDNGAGIDEKGGTVTLGWLVVPVVGFAVLAFAVSSVLGVAAGFFVALPVLGSLVGLGRRAQAGWADRPAGRR
jgi:hypothetical protein